MVGATESCEVLWGKFQINFKLSVNDSQKSFYHGIHLNFAHNSIEFFFSLINVLHLLHNLRFLSINIFFHKLSPHNFSNFKTFSGGIRAQRAQTIELFQRFEVTAVA